MKVLILAALVAVAAARPQEYHDDVFHFSSAVNPTTFAKQSSSTFQKTFVKEVQQPSTFLVRSSATPVVSQYVQKVHVAEPVYSQVHHVVNQPSTLIRTVEQEIPAVAVHQHHVHQPVYSQVSHVQEQVIPSSAVVSSRSSFVPAQYSSSSHSSFAPAQYSSSSVSSGAAFAPTQYSSSSVSSRSSFAPTQYSSSSVSSVPVFKILKQVQEFDPAGPYRVNYETENGIALSEQGTVKDIQAKEGPVASKEGSYSYTGPDGVLYTVNYIADEYGFRASGAHLPQAPEIPAEIQRSLELIASQPEKYDDDGNLVSVGVARKF